jgi:hypothetical protein
LPVVQLFFLPEEYVFKEAIALTASAQALSLRFNHEEFCDELYIHRKSPRLLSSRIQAAVLIAG